MVVQSKNIRQRTEKKAFQFKIAPPPETDNPEGYKSYAIPKMPYIPNVMDCMTLSFDLGPFIAGETYIVLEKTFFIFHRVQFCVLTLVTADQLREMQNKLLKDE